MRERRFLAVAVVGVLTAAVGIAGPLVLPSSLSTTSVIAADPPPRLFPEGRLVATRADLAAQRAPAAALVRQWTTTHGTDRDDAAFAAWVRSRFPAPPAGLSAEMAPVKALAAERTPAGVRASTWLEVHGKKDVWKLYAHDQRELLPSKRARALKGDEKDLLKLAKTVADALGTQYGSSAPYVLEPSLRPDHKVAAGQRCPCSYPSRHAAASAASETLLGHLDPGRDAEYRTMQAQVAYSRVYMAGHFPADIRAGAFLGDVLGDYVLVTRYAVDPNALD